MKILFLANDGEGLFKFRKELLSVLCNDHEVYISLPRDKYIESLRKIGCIYIETAFNRKGINPINDLKLLFFYLKTIRSIVPDVVLTYTIKPNVYGGIACQLSRIPYIVNITGLGSAVENNGILQKITCTLYRIGLRKAKKVFFQNQYNMEFMTGRKIIDVDRCFLIPGSGVNLNEYRVLDYPDDKTVDFVYIGRIMKEKGFEQYINAAVAIRKKHPESRFHICGEYEDDYKAKVDELSREGTVIYHGSVINMLEIYQIIHCTVHPTYYPEGLSNVLLESLACGRPIITTDRPGCREVVEDGINGFVVKQKDTEDLVEKIEAFLSLSREEKIRMGLNGRRKVEEEFDRNIVIHKYLEEINKIGT